MTMIKLDVSEPREFFDKMHKAASGDLKEAVAGFLKTLGRNMLDIFQEQIRITETVDTGRLLRSFQKGDSDNVWILDEGELTIEVGTRLDYASYVNDGHWTNPQGVERRWVPGEWIGNHFLYDPDAKTGMSLKQQWVEGKHFAEAAQRTIEDVFPGLLEEMLGKWFDEYFGG